MGKTITKVIDSVLVLRGLEPFCNSVVLDESFVNALLLLAHSCPRQEYILNQKQYEARWMNSKRTLFFLVWEGNNEPDGGLTESKGYSKSYKHQICNRLTFQTVLCLTSVSRLIS